MLSVFVVFFNVIIFVFVANIIVRNIMNIRNISDQFKTVYEQNQRQQEIYNNDKTIKKEPENITFDSSIELDNNPIKEKKGKRRNI